jgi:hypothetical protein
MEPAPRRFDETAGQFVSHRFRLVCRMQRIEQATVVKCSYRREVAMMYVVGSVGFRVAICDGIEYQ